MTEKQGGSDVRANVTTATPTVGGRRVHPRRAQVVHLRPDERRVPGAGAGGGRPLLLRGAPGPRRRHPQPARRRTAQGQAGEPVERVLGAGAPRHLGAAARRRGPRGAHDHRDGGGDPARLRARLRVADAPGAGGGVLARRAPVGLRRAARRQAADAERGRRPRRGVRGRHRAGDAARRGGRRRRRPARGGAAADRAAAGEVLGLQAHPDDGRGGAGVPGRQRLRRGVGDAAAVPGVAAELHLGGLGQRQRPRRAAGAVPRAGGAERLDRRGRPGPRRRPAPRPGDRGGPGVAGRRRVPRGRRPPARRADGGLPAGCAARAARPRRGRGRVLRHPARRPGTAARSAPSAARHRPGRRSWPAPRPSV